MLFENENNWQKKNEFGQNVLDNSDSKWNDNSSLHVFFCSLFLSISILSNIKNWTGNMDKIVLRNSRQIFANINLCSRKPYW